MVLILSFFILISGLILIAASTNSDEQRKKLLTSLGIDKLTWSAWEDPACFNAGCLYGDTQGHCFKCLPVDKMKTCDRLLGILQSQKAQFDEEAVELLRFASTSSPRTSYMSMGQLNPHTNQMIGSDRSLTVSPRVGGMLELKPFGNCKKRYEENPHKGEKDAYLSFDVLIGTTVLTTKHTRNTASRERGKVKQRSYKLEWGGGWSQRQSGKKTEIDPKAAEIFSGSTSLEAHKLTSVLKVADSEKKDDIAFMYLHTSYEKTLKSITDLKGKEGIMLTALLPSLDGNTALPTQNDRVAYQMEVGKVSIFDGHQQSIFRRLDEKPANEVREFASETCVIIACPKQPKRPIAVDAAAQKVKTALSELSKSILLKHGKNKAAASQERIRSTVKFVRLAIRYVTRAKELNAHDLKVQDGTGHLAGLSRTCKPDAIKTLQRMEYQAKSVKVEAVDEIFDEGDSKDEEDIPEYTGEAEEIQSLLQLGETLMVDSQNLRT